MEAQAAATPPTPSLAVSRLLGAGRSARRPAVHAAVVGEAARFFGVPVALLLGLEEPTGWSG